MCLAIAQYAWNENLKQACKAQQGRNALRDFRLQAEAKDLPPNPAEVPGMQLRE